MTDWADSEYRSDCYLNGGAEGYPPQPPLPKPARSGAFTYDDQHGLQASGFSRAALSELRLLFRKNASQARQAAATKPWITAQLRLYGIPFDNSSQENYLQAVKKHKIDVDQWHKQNFAELSDPTPEKSPEPVILWDLRDYSEGLQSRVDAIPGLSARVTQALTVIAWAAQLERGIDTAFALISSADIKCDRPTLEAYFDANRFLDKYFLDGVRGKPAPWKREEPLVLDYWVRSGNGLEKLSRAAERVPELRIQEASKPVYDDRWRCAKACVIVGWAKQVLALEEAWKPEIARLEMLQTEREKRNKEKAILTKLKPHIDYARAHRAPPPSSFTLDHLVGSYMVQCRQVEDEYGVELGSMTLDVQAATSTYGAVAAFNFGLVEGTMLLATSEDALENLRQEQPVRSSSSDESEEDMGYHLEYDTGPRKRKAASSQLSGPSRIRRRLGGDRPVKPGRFYFQWAGCQTVNSYLVLDAEHERTGHFDLDKSGMTARGELCWPSSIDKPLVFTLLKVADAPMKKPDAWSSYCEEERWIRW
ncbi:hypothetical protein F5Y19DRAFT_486308 [Xylariaceae sp. FL1651]|nr:hypothetical protein F5Y19DRAFT_486308 [Xylariaceae sp. FL1651]